MRRSFLLVMSITLIFAATLTVAPRVSAATEPSVVATITVGNGVAGIAVNPNTNRIYVANSIDKTISVIDGATNTVITTIPVGLTPNGIDVNPNTNQIYIANFGGPVDSGKAAVIDGNTNTVVATIPIAFNAHGIAVNSTTNRIYITTQTDTTFLPYVEVIDGATNTLAADILPFGNNFNPEGISVNSTTNKIYVADTATFPFEIDGATNTLTPLPLLGSSTVSTFGIDVNSTTNRVYLARPSSNCLCVAGNIDVADRSTNTVTSITVPPVNGNLASNAASIGVNPTTNHVFVAEGQSGSLLTLNGATNKFIFSPIPGVGGSSDITANPVTNRVYVATTTNGNQVSVIADVPNEPPTPPPTPVERTAPFDFVTELSGLINCNFTSTNGTGQAQVQSDIATGRLLLDLRARSDFHIHPISINPGKAEGRAAVGVKYVAPVTGRIKIDAIINVAGFDSLSNITLPKLGDTSIASVQSSVELLVKRLRPARDNLQDTTFAARIVTPSTSPIPGNPINIDMVTYIPPKTFSGSVEIDVLEGDQLFICAGIRSKVAVVSLVPWAATAKVLYGPTRSGDTKVQSVRISYE